MVRQKGVYQLDLSRIVHALARRAVAIESERTLHFRNVTESPLHIFFRFLRNWAGIEKAQSIDPKAVASVMAKVKFRTFYGGETGFGGKAIYGSDQRTSLPVLVTQVQNGKLDERARSNEQVVNRDVLSRP